MKRKVYLVGEIEKKFGSEFSMYADNYGEIIRNIDCNRPGFKEYLLESHDKGVGFTINFAGKNIEEKELLTPIKEGDVTIAAIPAGSKSEMGQIITGAILIVIGFYVGGMKGAMWGVEYAKWGSMITAVGMSLAVQGIQAMLAPDPATDEKEEEGYLYNGTEAIVVEGDPVPLLYGKLRVPGQPVSVALNTAGALSSFSGAGFGGMGSSHSDEEGGEGQQDCFDPDTFIQMADGSEKKIKDIELGDNIKGGEVTGVFQFKTSVDEMHDYKGVIVAGGHFVKENDEFIMVKDSPLAIKIDKIPIVYSLRTADRRIFINDIEFANYNGDGIVKNFLINAESDLTGFDKEVLRQVELRLI
jgi:predicted phage tail protein